MQYEINDTNINLVLFYSKLSMALVACRLIKTYGYMLGRPMNQTEEYQIRFAANSMIIGAATAFDKDRSATNLRRIVEQWATEKELHDALKHVDKLQTDYASTIKHILDYRNNLIAHTNKGINTIDKFISGPSGDVAKVQKVLNEALDILESLERHPKDIKRRTLDYTRIRQDLKE